MLSIAPDMGILCRTDDIGFEIDMAEVVAYPCNSDVCLLSWTGALNARTCRSRSPWTRGVDDKRCAAVGSVALDASAKVRCFNKPARAATCYVRAVSPSFSGVCSTYTFAMPSS